MQEIFQHTFDNGMVLIAERVPHVRSAAFSFSLRCGCAYDPSESLGIASVLAELLVRGAGERDSRALTAALDGLGVDRSEGAGVWMMTFGGATLSRNLLPALAIYADILRRPHLPASELEPVRAHALQDLESIEDEPQAKVMIELRRKHYPEPLGRDYRGSQDGLKSLTINRIRSHYDRHVQPRGLILAVAGDFAWSNLRDHVAERFETWQPVEFVEPTISGTRPTGGAMIKELDQTQIGIAYASVPMSHPDFYAARGAVGVLSEGMSSRLFTNVREKYGLCYAIGARYETMRDRANVMCYTGGKPERAQELLERTLYELTTLKDGIQEDELQRVKAGLKASLIMRQESTAARAGALASDWYLLGRVRLLDEMQRAVDSLTPQRVVDHLRAFPPGDFTIVTLGPEPLKD